MTPIPGMRQLRLVVRRLKYSFSAAKNDKNIVLLVHETPPFPELLINWRNPLVTSFLSKGKYELLWLEFFIVDY